MSYEKNNGELPKGEFTYEEIEREVAKIFSDKKAEQMFNNIVWGKPTFVDRGGNVVDLSNQNEVDLKDIDDELREEF